MAGKFPRPVSHRNCMSRDERKPTNRRAWRESSERRLLFLVAFALIVIGGGLIGLIYGRGALLTALPCLIAGAGGVVLPYLLLVAIERWRE